MGDFACLGNSQDIRKEGFLDYYSRFFMHKPIPVQVRHLHLQMNLQGHAGTANEFARPRRYCKFNCIQTLHLFTLLPFYPFTLIPFYLALYLQMNLQGRDGTTNLIAFRPSTFLPFYLFTLLPFYPVTLLPCYPNTILSCAILANEFARPSRYCKFNCIQTLHLFTLLPFYPFTLLPFYPITLLPYYPITILPCAILANEFARPRRYCILSIWQKLERNHFLI